MRGSSPLLYSERPAPSHLRSLVRCFWTLRTDRPLSDPEAKLVLPDGCSDLIVNLGDPPGPGLGERRAMSGYIVGAMTRALVVPLVGQVELFGVRFQPGAGMPLFGVPAQELTDSAWPLEAVWRDEAHLAERLRESDDRPGFLGRILERHLGSRARHPDPRVVLAIGIMEQRRGDVRIDGIAEACGIGRRQLERLCRRDIGTSPKVAARVCRLQHAVSFLRSKPTAGLARVAAVAGYADQAHLNREFTSVVGVTPGVFRRQGL